MFGSLQLVAAASRLDCVMFEKIVKRTFVLVALVAFPAVMLFFALGVLTVNVPYWDDYGAIVKYMGWPFAERMRHLFDFHNEHRIVTVRLFLEAMAGITGKVNFKGCMLFGTAQLLVVFACFAFTFLRQFGRGLGLAALSLASWHLFSMLNFDNAFWALTALENFGVLMWAFLAILFFCGENRLWRQLLAWVFAVLAVLTSAQGLAVLGAMIAIALIPKGEIDSWREMWRNVCRHFPYQAFGAVVFSMLVLLLYFRGFTLNSEGEAAISASIADRTLYVIAFLGNLVPIYPIALVCGCLVAIGISYVIWSFPRLPIAMRPVFFFMVYGVGVAVAGVFFRASDPRAALSFRYYVITACLFISLVGCLLALNGRLPRILRTCLPILIIGFCLLNLAVFFVGRPLFSERNEALRVNMLTWPEHKEGLRIDDGFRSDASRYLRRLEERGLYDHTKLLRNGETPPSEPIAWPKPRF